jgi:DNA-binding transcriptional regulator YdaS (Cro superfamily)
LKRQINAPAGVQSRIVRKLAKRQTPISQPIVSQILSGKRRATPEQATALEPVLAELGYAISRVDMVFNYQKNRSLLGGNC